MSAKKPRAIMVFKRTALAAYFNELDTLENPDC